MQIGVERRGPVSENCAGVGDVCRKRKKMYCGRKYTLKDAQRRKEEENA